MAVVIALPVRGQEERPPLSFLRAGDHIVFIGDSITEAGIYGRMVQRALQATYPDANLKAVSHGSGGKTAAAGTGLLKHYLSAAKPTIVAVMFGVNDTGWSAAGIEQKAAAFTTHLKAIIDQCRENSLEVVLIRTSHFSHNATRDAWVDGINSALDQLLKAQDELARENKVPLIDAYGAYVEALAHAWKVDPLYEFTPDVIHPLEVGSAAVAGKILKAFGVGLPLATELRGSMNPSPAQGLHVSVGGRAGSVPNDGEVPVRLVIRNNTLEPASGRLRCTIGSWSTVVHSGEIEPRVAASIQVGVPARALRERVSCDPVHVAYRTGTRVAFGQSVFQYSRIANLSELVYAAPAGEFQPIAGARKEGAPVKKVSLKANGGEIGIHFTWSDATVVPAKPGFKSRFGAQIDTPLDLNARPGDQRADAVEILLDTRPEESAARYTSSSDGNPPGTVRVGIYRTGAEDGADSIGMQVHPAELQSMVELSRPGPDQYRVTVKGVPPEGHFGFAMLATDVPGPGKPAAVYYLGGEHAMDPIGFIRMSATRDGVYYRIGY